MGHRQQRRARVVRLDVPEETGPLGTFRRGRPRKIDVPDLLRGHGGDSGAAAAHLATIQEGLIRIDQLRALGLGTDTARSRHARYSLHRVHRGVYLLGHAALTPAAELLAAAFAGGPQALVSHLFAAYALGTAPRPAGPPSITTPGPRRSRPHLRLHQGAVASADVGHVGAIPVTGPVRTLLDVATTGDLRTLERVMDQALIRRLVGERELQAAFTRYRGHHGLGPLRALLAGRADPDFSRSEAERLLLRLVREAGLATPRRNVEIAGWEVDFLWPEERLIVELDGYRFHSGRTSFERDRRKTAELEDAGFRVLRLSWRQLAEQPTWVIARIAERLARGPRR
jgi:very-short-patch-repair endonuclease